MRVRGVIIALTTRVKAMMASPKLLNSQSYSTIKLFSMGLISSIFHSSTTTSASLFQIVAP